MKNLQLERTKDTANVSAKLMSYGTALMDEVDFEIEWKADRQNTQPLSQRERERLEDDINEAELIRSFIKIERVELVGILENLLNENLPPVARDVIAGLAQRFNQEVARQVSAEVRDPTWDYRT